MLRVRGDVLGEEPGRVGGDVRGQGGRYQAVGGGGGLRRRRLVPDAHRRRAVPDAHRGADDAPGEDPRGHRRRRMTGATGSMPTYLGMPSFPQAARTAVADSQLRRNLTHATTTIRTKRAKAVAELDDWEQLRQAAKAIKDHVLANLGTYLPRLEENVTRAGGHVHWARDAAEANAIVTNLVKAANAGKVVKVKSMATQETGLNEALAASGITAVETDLAELIVQLGDDPPRLAAAARQHLRNEFLAAEVGISGANFAIADTGSLVVLESEGNGRMCLTLPRTLITVMGIEKLVPTFGDLEVFLQLLPR